MPNIAFLETDAAVIAAANLARLEAETGRALYPGDPVRLIGLALSYVQALVASAANDAANQSFLDNAHGLSLDALGASVGVTRTPAEAARCTLRFSLAAARGEVTLVPMGTRATVQGSGIYWATIAAAEIGIGDTYVDEIGEATVSGLDGNGFLTGEIDTLVDNVAFVTSVINMSASTDGSMAEDDESIRERIREAPTRFSVAGPEDAYIALAKDSRADVEDVKVNSPTPRVIDLYVTLTGGAIPASETIAEILAYCNGKYRRPMSDVVNVHAPTPVEYTIDFTYYIATGDSARAGEIQAAVTAAVAEFVSWQRASISRDVNPSELIRRVMNAGALRVDVTAPADTALDYSELAVLDGEADVEFGGLADE